MPRISKKNDQEVTPLVTSEILTDSKVSDVKNEDSQVSSEIKSEKPILNFSDDFESKAFDIDSLVSTLSDDKFDLHLESDKKTENPQPTTPKSDLSQNSLSSVDKFISGENVPAENQSQTQPSSQFPERRTRGNWTPSTPVRRGGRFNGLVDNRVIPDADLPTEELEGILDMDSAGHGLLRTEYSGMDKNVYISASQIRRFRLRQGDMVKGPARQPKETERFWGLLKISEINGTVVTNIVDRVHFDRLVPVYPNHQLKLEIGKDPLINRLIDLICPIGKGQRGLIVAPPKAGKTTIMKHIANGITANNPDIFLMAVLVGERPEEVTDFRRSIRGEVAASNFDEQPEQQVHVAELALERAKRLVELGKDVVILLDSITRLARAYNLAIPSSGRTLSGGFDPAALYPPKKFFGAARNFEAFQTPDGQKSGSLTIIGTALVDTGSRMDDLVYEEFKGTGNMELHLDRKTAERRIFPAMDIQKSGTRQDALLYGEEVNKKIKTLITMIDMLGANERTEILIERLNKTKTNEEFLNNLGK